MWTRSHPTELRGGSNIRYIWWSVCPPLCRWSVGMMCLNVDSRTDAMDGEILTCRLWSGLRGESYAPERNAPHFHHATRDRSFVPSAMGGGAGGCDNQHSIAAISKQAIAGMPVVRYRAIACPGRLGSGPFAGSGNFSCFASVFHSAPPSRLFQAMWESRFAVSGIRSRLAPIRSRHRGPRDRASS